MTAHKAPTGGTHLLKSSRQMGQHVTLEHPNRGTISLSEGYNGGSGHAVCSPLNRYSNVPFTLTCALSLSRERPFVTIANSHE